MSSTLTDLTAATTWSGTDLFYALVGGNSRKIAAAKFLVAETASSLAMQDSTTAQTFRVYRTFTDSSNYERLALQTGSGYVELAAETAGTGTDNISVQLTPAGTGQILITGTSLSGGLPLMITTNNLVDTFVNIGRFYAAGLTTGQRGAVGVGKNSSTGNSASFAFKWVGDNDGTNTFDVNFSGLADPNISLEKAGTVRLLQGIAMPANGSSNVRLLFTSTANFGIYCGSGAPTVSAAQGSIYLRTDGSSTSSRLYVNTNGSTTWTSVTTAA